MTALIPNSIRGRLLLATAILLPAFLGITGTLLDRAYYRSLLTAQEEQLRLQVYALLAEADYVDTLEMPAQMLEARLNQLNSGLYAGVSDASDELVWQSPSAETRDLTPFASKLPDIAAGQSHFDSWAAHFVFAYGVIWETETSGEQQFTIMVVADNEPVSAELAAYRANLWAGLAIVAGLLILSLMLVVGWGLRPLRGLAADLNAIENGEADALSGEYPTEVQPVTDNLNRLLDSERQRRERFRNKLSDLAHSLKTPLAVMQAERDNPDVVQQQTQAMQQIVDYQLKRAINRKENLLKPIAVAPALARVRAALDKVYSDKNIRWSLDVPGQVEFRGDEGDLMELLGNLLDNACKYGKSQVRIGARHIDGDLELRIGDDGPGIPAQLRGDILQRGARADTANHGQGIGLAVVIDIVSAYGGELLVEDSAFGGAEFVLILPQ